MGPASTLADVHRRGFSARKVVLGMALVVGLSALGYAFWPGRSWGNDEIDVEFIPVSKGEFVHALTEEGAIESGNNVEVRCQVKANGGQGTTLLEVASEGTVVEQGDILAKLDSSALEAEQTKQKIAVNMSEAEVIKAQTTLDTAVLAKKEFLDGTYKQQLQTIESEIFVARENLSRAEQYALFSAQLAKKGYVTRTQLKADQFAVEKAQTDLAAAETKRRVLTDYTRIKTVTQLEADIKSAEAKLKAQQESHKLESEKLALINDQIAKCEIRAPCAGQVVYPAPANTMGSQPTVIEPGVRVYERQEIVRLPDRDNMQVKAKINESKVALVTKGQAVSIRVDALPDVDLFGTVEKVNEYPVPQSWRVSSTVKEYETIIRIHHSPPGLRTGLTAQVKIHVQRIPAALQVPVQAVIEDKDRLFCIVKTARGYEAREVKAGSTNGETVVIRNGLTEEDQVVQNAAKLRGRVDLPPALEDKTPAALAEAQQQQPVPRAEASAGTDGPRRGGKRGGSGKSRTERGGTLAAMSDRLFQEYDKGGRGQIALADLPESVRTRVAAADTNGDGIVDRGELAAAAARQAGSKPAGPPSSTPHL